MHLDVHGVEATEKRYRIDDRTLKRWQAKEPSGWEREEELNRLVMAEAHIAGTVKYRDAVVGRGIAWDKLWRIARRKEVEARRAEEQPKPEQPDPVQLAVDALREDQQRLMIDIIDTLEAARDADPDQPEPDAVPTEVFAAQMLEWIGTISAMSEEQVAERITELSAERERLDDEAAAAQVPRPPDPPLTAPDPISPPTAPPEPFDAVQTPSRPFGLHVVSAQEATDPFSDRNHPSWKRSLWPHP